MKTAIVYYPSIVIPNGGWLRSALLYWDEVASIVPESLRIATTINMGKELKYLEDEGEYKSISPEWVFEHNRHSSEGEAIAEDFLSLLDVSQFKKVEWNSKNARFLIYKYKFPLFHLHLAKIPGTLEEKLRELRLVTPTRDPDILSMEPMAGMLYMSLLARHCAKAHDGYAVPGTDNPLCEELAFFSRPNQPRAVALRLSLLRALPEPYPDIELSKLVRFKRRYRDELLRFRGEMSQLSDRLSKCESDEQAKAALATFSDRSIVAISDLEKALSSQQIRTLWGSLKALINLKSPVKLAGAAMAAMGITWAVALPIGAAGAAVDVGGVFIDGKLTKDELIRKSDFAYLYRARKQSILKI